MWLWPFESDFGLKVPSLIFLVASVLAAALWRPESLTRGQAWFWAALILLWRPGTTLFIDARYYGLLFLISVAQTIAFVRLIERPSLKRAYSWTVFAALAILTHYFAAVAAFAQALLLLWRLRSATLRLWPAALPFGVPAIELAWHWPRLQAYATHSWYGLVRPAQIPEYLAWPLTGSVLSGVAVLALLVVFRRKPPAPITIAVLASLLSMLVLIVLGSIRPMLIERYLIPVAPGLLMAIAAFTRPVVWLPVAALLCLSLEPPRRLKAELENRAWYGLEVPVRDVPPSARTIGWTMIYTGAEVLDGEQMRRLLADALARNGRSAEVRWASAGSDATIILATPPKYMPGCRVHEGLNSTTLICGRR
jgi:hypothetical protein